ncbi:hypothetical protein ACOBR2_03780 [Telmatobacter bradus]|uniref:hypothetical protein n=1 Tax=Telmatobacter bradus TaxID=474953 RepID=UPI003B4281B3
MRRFFLSLLMILLFLMGAAVIVIAAPHKTHVIALGMAKQVSYSLVGDPAGAASSEKFLKVRPILVDGVLKEWTTGDAHDVTDRSFVVRRAIRINDTLPGEPVGRWVWQRGPWMMVDRVTGHVVMLHLPDYDPTVSRVSWFRDYAAYCGLNASGKGLFAVVTQIGARKPVLSKKMGDYDAASRPDPVCGPVEWQREPLRAAFHPTGREAISYDVVPGSAVLVEESADEADDEPATPEKEK